VKSGKTMPKKGKNKRRKTTPDEIAGHLKTEIKKKETRNQNRSSSSTVSSPT